MYPPNLITYEPTTIVFTFGLIRRLRLMNQTALKVEMDTERILLRTIWDSREGKKQGTKTRIVRVRDKLIVLAAFYKSLPGDGSFAESGTS